MAIINVSNNGSISLENYFYEDETSKRRKNIAKSVALSPIHGLLAILGLIVRFLYKLISFFSSVIKQLYRIISFPITKEQNKHLKSAMMRIAETDKSDCSTVEQFVGEVLSLPTNKETIEYYKVYAEDVIKKREELNKIADERDKNDIENGNDEKMKKLYNLLKKITGSEMPFNMTDDVFTRQMYYGTVSIRDILYKSDYLHKINIGSSLKQTFLSFSGLFSRNDSYRSSENSFENVKQYLKNFEIVQKQIKIDLKEVNFNIKAIEKEREKEEVMDEKVKDFTDMLYLLSQLYLDTLKVNYKRNVIKYSIFVTLYKCIRLMKE